MFQYEGHDIFYTVPFSNGMHERLNTFDNKFFLCSAHSKTLKSKCILCQGSGQ